MNAKPLLAHVCQVILLLLEIAVSAPDPGGNHSAGVGVSSRIMIKLFSAAQDVQYIRVGR